MMVKIECPECLERFDVEDVIVDEVVVCPSCGTDVVIKEIGEKGAVVGAVKLAKEDWGE